MADDTVDEEPVQDRGEEDTDAPKKTFGILAARFLQKGKSSPGSTTGEFEALSLPNSTSSPESKVRNLHPIDDDDDDIREGSIHGVEVPLSESLYADIGLDEISTFDDSSTNNDLVPGIDSSEESAEGAAPDIVYDIDAAEPPVISFGSGVEEPPVQPDKHSYQTAEAEPAYQFGTDEVAESGTAPDYQYGAEDVASAIESTENEYETEPAATAEVLPPDYAEPAYIEAKAEQHLIEAESDTEINAQPAYEPESEYAPEPAFEPQATYEPAVAFEAEPEVEQTPAFDAAALDAIGAKAELEAASFDKNALDQIGSDNEINDKIFVTNETPPAPEKKGLLGKFAPKKESAVRPLIGGGKKDATPEPTGGNPFDVAAVDQSGSKGFDAAALDSIGSKGFDAGALDSIGTKGFEKEALDSIGEPSTPAAEKDKPKSGGLLGGKIGQKAKILGSEKAKLGGTIPPATDPTFDQKETGRFMVNAPEGVDSISASDSLTTAQSEDFSAPASDFSAPADDDFAPPAKEALSASFFDDAKEEYVEEENVPVIGSDEIGRLITDADNAYRVKQYKAAEPIFASVLEKLDKIGDDTDPLLPYCLDKMSDNLFQMKKYKESLQFFRRLLVLHTKISSADRDMISTLYKIAQTSEALNLTSEADSMYKRAFRLGQQSLVPGDPLLAKVLEGYGTMLMRSEGAEPPAAASTAEKTADQTADQTAAEKSSALSAEEIAMLNSLGASADRAASEASPIILSGGLTDQSSSKARIPLKETDERVDKARASSVGSNTNAGNVWIRLGIFVAIISAFVLVTLNMNTDFSTHNVAHSKDFVKRVYKSLDGLSTFTIFSEDQASKDNFGKHFVYEYRGWAGTPHDDMEVISGQVGGDNFIYEVPQGIKDGSGFIFYDPHAPELSVTAKMHELGTRAQAYYKAKGKYPDGKEIEKLAKSVTYKNPFGEGVDSVTANSIAWPPNLDASQIFIKSRFDTSLEEGTPWEGEPQGKPGQISAASSSTKQPDASVFYVHGRDRSGNLITRADGKVFILIFKNGIEVTPGAADFKNEKPTPTPIQMRLSKTNNSINILTILLSYIPMILFAVLSVIFLGMANNDTDRSRSWSLPRFGLIWSPSMVLLTGLAKFLPSPFSTIFLVLSIVAFIGGLAWLVLKFVKTSPKKSKKPPPEATAM
ncbi:hypothetical protein BH10CYA1_BH10CYA1_15240 [soil metagenome]